MPSRRAVPRAPLAWWLLGLLAFTLLPWYLSQDLSLWRALPGVFGDTDTAAGLVQALHHGKPWLWFAAFGLVAAGVALRLPVGPAQGRVLVAAAGIGLAGLLIAGFAIGA
jgi:iron(III) transport system permease protein